MNNAVFSKITYGFYLVTTRFGKEMDGTVIHELMQVTSSPDRILFTLDKTCETHNLLIESKEAVISVLSIEADASLVDYFNEIPIDTADGEESVPPQRAPKFRTDSNHYPYALTHSGIPYLLRKANAYLCCHTITTTDLGTHTLFLAEVTDGDLLSNTHSLVYRKKTSSD